MWGLTIEQRFAFDERRGSGDEGQGSDSDDEWDYSKFSGDEVFQEPDEDEIDDEDQNNECDGGELDC